jgi:ABC-2 type transport system ATP-binding protein
MDIVRAESLLKVQLPWEGFTLGHVNLQLGPGEILGVMGAKGAGKSTLLRLLWGFARPTSGTLEVFGLIPHLHQIEVRFKGGFVSGSRGFYEWMTVRDFLRFISNFYPNWDESHAERLLADFDIESGMDVRGLSKGDKLKLAIVAATGHRPLLLLLDEPMLGQDPGLWLEIQSFLKQLARDEKVSIVISSDVSDNLDRLAETVLMLKRGTVLHCCSSAALKKEFGVSSLEDIFLESDKASKRSHHANA